MPVFDFVTLTGNFSLLVVLENFSKTFNSAFSDRFSAFIQNTERVSHHALGSSVLSFVLCSKDTEDWKTQDEHETLGRH